MTAVYGLAGAGPVRRSIRAAALLACILAPWSGTVGAQEPGQSPRLHRPLLAAAGQAQDAALRPVWRSRWCLSPLALYGTDELSPEDQSRPVEKNSWFRDLPLIQVGIDVPPSACDGPCIGRISETVADSLTLWRHACGRCSYDFLVGVIAPDELFLDERIYLALSNAQMDVYGAVAQAESWLSGATGFKSASGHVIVPYYRVPYSHQVLDRFCAADPARLWALWASKLWSATCPGPASSEVPPPELALSFVSGDTDCGSAAEFIACGDPSKRIELTLWETRYEIEQSPTRAYGQPAALPVLGDPGGLAVDLHAVLLHEIGHFLGLDHLQEKNRPASLKASMQPTYNSEMCVSIADILLRTSAADALWAHRVVSCSGLRRPVSP